MDTTTALLDDEQRFMRIDAECQRLHLLGYHAVAVRLVPRSSIFRSNAEAAWHNVLEGAAKTWIGWTGGASLLTDGIARVPAARNHVPELVIALALAGEVATAREWLAELNPRLPMSMLAKGHVSLRLSDVRQAADLARASREQAVEVLCLQVLARFGDTSGATRLRGLTSVVDGPRVFLAARHAAALQNRSVCQLWRVAQAYEETNDFLAAMDAAAQAALIAERGVGGVMGSKAARSAVEIARFCGWPKTPAFVAFELGHHFG